MYKLFFGTTNESKLKEARDILKTDIEGISLSIDEVQSLDPIEVVTKKGLAYYSQIKHPLFVDDTSLIFNGLKQLPGTLIDYFFKSLNNEGLIKLLENSSDRSAIAQVSIAYIDEYELVHIFEGKIEGEISIELRGTNGFGWDPIFIPKGFNKTFAEMTDEEKASCSMRKIAFEQFADFLNKKP